MTKRYYFWIIVLSFILFSGASFYISHLLFAGSELFVAGTMLLLLLAAIVLTDMLQVWLLILTEVIVTVIMIFGVSYIQIRERVFFVCLILVYSFFCLFIKRKYFQYVTGNEIMPAKRFYQHLLRSKEPDFPMGLRLVSWAHFNQFAEVNPKESKTILGLIRTKLKQASETRRAYYIGSGCFLVFSRMRGGDSHITSEDIKGILGEIKFNNFTSLQGIQFRSGYQELNKDVVNEYNLDELLGKMKRQLETDIVVEY